MPMAEPESGDEIDIMLDELIPNAEPKVSEELSDISDSEVESIFKGVIETDIERGLREIDERIAMAKARLDIVPDRNATLSTIRMLEARKLRLLGEQDLKKAA